MKRSEQLKNVTIGLFVVASLAIGTWLLLFLSPETGDAAKIFRAQFADIDKISLGTRVTFAGKPVGEVIQINQVESARTKGEGRERQVYIFELTMTLDSSITIYTTDKLTVRTSGLLGEKSVAIIPQLPKYGQESRPVGPDEILRADAGGSMEEALAELEGLATKASQALDDVIDLIDANNKDLNLAIKSVHQSLTGISIFMERMNELDVSGTLSRAGEDFSKVMEQMGAQLDIFEQRNLMNTLADVAEHVNHITEAVDQPEALADIVVNVQKLSESLDKLQERVSGSWDKIDTAFEDFALAGKNTVKATHDFKEVGENIRKLSKEMLAGQGTAGKFLASDDFYLRTVNLMNKFDTVMNDVNHYGILFHLDKGWQRQRVRRMNLLQELCTADQFRDYFEEEVDQINTSLSRVSMLMHRSRGDEKCAAPFHDQEFSRVFSDLLRQVEGLESTLKLYNSSLLEEQGHMQ